MCSENCLNKCMMQKDDLLRVSFIESLFIVVLLLTQEQFIGTMSHDENFIMTQSLALFKKLQKIRKEPGRLRKGKG